jgi:hypothetical protein
MASSAAVDRVYEVRNHKMLDVLDRPDPDGFFDRKSLIGFLTLSMDVLSSGYLVPDGNGWDRTTGAVGTNAPECLWVLYSQYVYGIPRPSDPRPEYWQYFAEKIPIASAIWFRQSVSLRHPYGSAYAPAYAGDMYQDQEQRMVAIADQLLGMGPRPNVIIRPSTLKQPSMMKAEHEQALEQGEHAMEQGAAAMENDAKMTEFQTTETPDEPASEGEERALVERARWLIGQIEGRRAG